MAQTASINSAVYTGGSVIVQWTPPSGQNPLSYSIQVIPAAGGTAIAQQGNYFMTFGTLTLPTLPAGQWQVQVGAVFTNGGTPVWGQGVLLFTPQPIVSKAVYNGTEVYVEWGALASPSLAVNSWQINVWVPDGGGENYSAVISSATATSGRVSLPAPLVPPAPGSLYAVTVMANAAVNSSSRSNPVNLNTQLPAFTSVIYSGNQLQAFWNGPVSPSIPITSFTLQLQDEKGAIVFSHNLANPAAASDTLPIPALLNPAQKYYVVVAAITAAQAYAASSSLQINPEQPVLIKAQLRNSAKLMLAVNWQPLGIVPMAAISYQILVWSTTSGKTYNTTITDPYASSGTVDVSDSWDPSNDYNVQVAAIAAGNILQTRTTACPIPNQLPALTSIQLADSTASFSWTGIQDRLHLLNKYTIQVKDADHATWYSQDIGVPGALTTIINLLNGLNDQLTYTASVEAHYTGGIASAVCDDVSLLTVFPMLSNLLYDGSNVEAFWDLSGTTHAITSYTMLVTGTNGQGYKAENISVQVSNYKLPVPATAPFTTLDPAQVWQVQILALVNGVVSTASEPVPLIVSLPVLNSLVYNTDVPNLGFSFTPATDAATPLAGYILALFSPGSGTSYQAYVNNPNLTYGVIPLASNNLPDPGLTWNAFVRTRAYGINNSSNSNGLVLNSGTTSMASAAYDGQHLQLAATAVAGDALYHFHLLQGAVLVNEWESSSASLSVPVILDPGKTYSVKVKYALAQSYGSFGTSLTLINAAPVVTNCSYNGAKLSVTWKTAPGANAYTIIVMNQTVQVATSSVGDVTTDEITVALLAYTQYTVLVTPSHGSVTGPSSQPADVISTAPSLVSSGYDGSTVSLGWNDLNDPLLTAYGVTIYKDDVAQTPVYYTKLDQIAITGLTIASGHTWKVGVQALSNAASGPTSAQTTLIIDAPVISKALWDGKFVEVHWAALTGLSTYTVTLLENGLAIVNVSVADTKATIETNLSAASVYTVQVQAIGTGNTTGPYGMAVQLINMAPVISSVQYSSTGTLTVFWKPVTDAASYQLRLFCEDLEETIVPTYDTNEATVTGLTLSETKTYSVTVTAIKDHVTGPASAAEPLITAVPVLTTPKYEAGLLFLSWGSISQPTVNGYKVVLTGGTGKILYSPTNSLQFDPGFVAGTTYSIAVMAVGNKATGPSSVGANPYVQEPAFYFSVNTSGAGQLYFPYVFNSAGQPPLPAAFDLYLPQVFNIPPATLPSSLTNPTVPPSPAVSSFVMSTNSTPNLPYKVTVALNSEAFTFPAASWVTIRTTLQQDYANFIQNLEAVTGGLLPGAVQLIQQIVARSFPLSYDETLLYGYGYNPAQRYVNLQAGMRLTLSFESFQFTGSNTAPLQNGYVGSGSSSYILGSYLSGAGGGTQTLDIGFCEFLARMVQNVETNTGGGGGVLDYYLANLRQPWIRLIYPTTFPSSDKSGSSSLEKNIILLAAPSSTTLESATNTIVNGGSVPAGVYATFLRGRTILIPEIQVNVNGSYVWVAVGTTLRQLLEQFSGMPIRPPVGSPAIGASTWKETGLKLQRSVENIITDVTQVSTGYAIGAKQTVNLAYNPVTVYPNGTDTFDLPLMQGDIIYF